MIFVDLSGTGPNCGRTTVQNRPTRKYMVEIQSQRAPTYAVCPMAGHTLYRSSSRLFARAQLDSQRLSAQQTKSKANA